MSEHSKNRVDDAALAELLRAAGRGPQLSDQARVRIRAAVHERWVASVAAERGASVTTLRSRRRPRAVMTGWLALAATLAGAAVLVLQWQEPLGDADELFASVLRTDGRVTIERDGRVLTLDGPEAALRVGDRLTTARGERVALGLESGQQLRVDANASLTVMAPTAIELTRGAVYFDSRGTSNADFDIQTALGTVSHIGTQYEVSYSPARLRIRVREGVAAVDRSGRPIEANAGEQLQVSREGDVSRVVFAANDPAWQWVESLAVVEPAAEHNLLAILEWISRETGVTLRFDDPATEARVRNVEVSGLTGFNPREALAAITAATAFGYRIGDTQLLVSTAP